MKQIQEREICKNTVAYNPVMYTVPVDYIHSSISHQSYTKSDLDCLIIVAILSK